MTFEGQMSESGAGQKQYFNTEAKLATVDFKTIGGNR